MAGWLAGPVMRLALSVPAAKVILVQKGKHPISRFAADSVLLRNLFHPNRKFGARLARSC
jgi:hypothetical protein